MVLYRITFVANNAVPGGKAAFGDNFVIANKYELAYNHFELTHDTDGEDASTRTLFGVLPIGTTLYTFTQETAYRYDEETGDKYDDVTKSFYQITKFKVLGKAIVERMIKLECDFLKEGAEFRAHGDAFYVKTIDGNIFYINPVTRKVCETDYFPPLVIHHTETCENGATLDVRVNEQGIVTFMAFGPQIKIFDIERHDMSATVVCQPASNEKEDRYIFFAAVRDESGVKHYIDTPYVTLKEDGSYAKISSVCPVDSPGKLRVNGMTLTLGRPEPLSIGSICDDDYFVPWFYWSKEDRKDEDPAFSV